MRLSEIVVTKSQYVEICGLVGLPVKEPLDMPWLGQVTFLISNMPDDKFFGLSRDLQMACNKLVSDCNKKRLTEIVDEPAPEQG